MTLPSLPSGDLINEAVDTIKEVTKPGFFQSIDWSSLALKWFRILLILGIGFLVIRLLTKLTDKLLTARGIRRAPRHFLLSTLKFFLYFVLLLIFTSLVGIETTSVVALVGSFGLAVGLALQGSMSDLASGILLIFLHPFYNGDYVFLGDDQATLLKVEDIRFFNTTFLDTRNYRYILPNSKITQGTIVNISTDPVVRVKVPFSVAYAADTEEVRRVVLRYLSTLDCLIGDGDPLVVVTDLADSSVEFLAIVSSDPADFMRVRCLMMEGIKKALDEAGIEIPFPQMDLHLRSQDSPLQVKAVGSVLSEAEVIAPSQTGEK